MSAPPPPPPSYNESMQQSSGYGGMYQHSYGTVPPPPPHGYDPSKAGAPVPQHTAYQMPPPTGQMSSQQSNIIVHPTQSVVVVGGCPACRVGVLEEDFTCCGVLLAILFFPLGVLCCLAMRQRRCAHCGAIFG